MFFVATIFRCPILPFSSKWLFSVPGGFTPPVWQKTFFPLATIGIYVFKPTHVCFFPPPEVAF